jgi:MoxR-like ATPase
MAQARLSRYDQAAMSFEQQELAKKLLRALKETDQLPSSVRWKGPEVKWEAKFGTTDVKHLIVTTQRGGQGKVFLNGTELVKNWSDPQSVSRVLCTAIRERKLDVGTFPTFNIQSIGGPAPVREDQRGIIVKDDHVIVHGIKLPRFPQPGPLTPTKEEVDEMVGVDREMKIIAAALAQSMPILLEGDTGTGKTSILQYLAHICNVNLVKVVGDPEYGPSLWLGHLHAKDGATYWVDGDLPTAMKGAEYDDGIPGRTWLFVDELSRMLPDNASPMMPVLERRGGRLGKLRLADNPDPDGKIVESHEDFRVVMAMNPFDADFAGTHEVDLALLRRASVRLEMNYPSANTQLSILKKKFKDLDQAILTRVTNVAEKLRADRKARRVSFPCSPDVLEAWCTLIPVLGYAEAAQVTMVNKATTEDRPRVRDLVEGKA